MVIANANIIGRSGGGGIIPGDGLFKDLLSQPGNRSTDIKLKICSRTDDTPWNGAAVSASNIRMWPPQSPIGWKALVDVGNGEAPPPYNSKWQIWVAPEMLQNLGGGKYGLMTMQRDEGEFIKLGLASIGTVSLSQFSYNFDDVGAALFLNRYGFGDVVATTAATSVLTPTAHPSSRTLTIATGLTSIPNSSTLGSCLTSLTIPSSLNPTFITFTLPTGLTIGKGESITLYGDANNFFTVSVARYDSVTGVAYGGTVEFVGSGTFSNWTVKREKLLSFNRTANPTGNNFLGVVQSYNSGTGEVIVNSIKNTGTGTFAGWNVTHWKGTIPAATVGQGSTISQDGSTLGQSGVVTFKGTRLIHRCTTDNRGCGFRYVYAGGPLINNPPADVIIDTYSVGALSAQSKLVVNDLVLGEHTYVFYTITSPTGASTNLRGFLSSSTNLIPSYSQEINYDLFTPDFNAVKRGQSTGEFAWKIKQNGSADATIWMPYHGFELMKSANPEVIVDDEVIDIDNPTIMDGINPYFFKFIPFTSCEINQSGSINTPVVTFGNYTSKHIIDRDGIRWPAITINWTLDTLKETAYTAMLFLEKDYCTNLLFNTGGNYPAPTVANIPLNAPDLPATSFLAYNNGSGVLGEPNYAVAMMYESQDTMPWTVASQIGNYDAAAIKLYPVTALNGVVLAGTTQVVKGRIYIGNIGSL